MKGQTREERKPARRECKRQRTMALFVQAAEQLIRTEGPSAVTIRRIAGSTGYSSAALYSYFADLEELVLYASLQYRRACLEEAAREIAPDMSALEQYRRFCEIFNRHALRAPEIYLNMYFGRHSGRIEAVMDAYCRLFPGALTGSAELSPGLPAWDCQPDGGRSAARRLAEEGYIRPENADTVAELLLRTQESFLYGMTVDPQQDAEARNAAFLALFDRIIEAF